MHHELNEIKEKVINRICVLTAIFLSLPYVFSILRWNELGWQNIYLYHSILYVSVLVLVLLRKKLGFNLKLSIITVIYCLIAFIGLLNFGFSGGYFFIIVAVAILSILVKRIYVYYLIGIVVVVFTLVCIGYVSNKIEPVIDLNQLVRKTTHWIASLFGIISISLIFIYGFGDFYVQLISTLKKKEETSKELLSKKELLESTEKKYRLLFEQANDAITLLKNGVFFDCNKKASEMFSLEYDDLIGKSPIDVSPEKQYNGEASGERAMRFVGLALKGEPQQFEWQHIKADGTLFDVSISLNKIELHNEIYVQGVLRDITEKKKKEAELEDYRNNLEKLVKVKTEDLETANEELKATNEELYVKNDVISSQNTELKATLQHLKETQMQLIQADKMASLGVLTAGVAHEINNPLNYIMGAYVGLKKYHENGKGEIEDEDVNVFLNALKVGVERSSSIVKGLNQFSRVSENYNETCVIQDVVDNTLIMLNNKLKHKAEIKKNYNGLKTNVIGNVGKLHQVFMNILSNSADAIEENGEIQISSRKNDSSIIISVKDNGKGIAKDNLQKITDPFFTTKEPGKGTGLGLSITYNIISEHKGKLEIESEINIGTEVIITLPLI